jgi:hypothetical protein
MSGSRLNSLPNRSIPDATAEDVLQLLPPARLVEPGTGGPDEREARMSHAGRGARK